MKVLITGGGGFIGSKLSKFLSIKGYDVFIITSRDKSIFYWLPENKVCQIKWGSSIDFDDLCKNIDIIIHASGMDNYDLSKAKYFSNFHELVTKKLIESAIKNKVKTIIYLSTFHVYCNLLSKKIDEKHPVCNTNLYTNHHIDGENMIMLANKNQRVNATIVRLSNVFGVPAHANVNSWHLLVQDLCRQAVTNNKIQLKSDGLEYRNFIPISNVCMGIEHLMLLSKKDLDDGVFNLGGSHSMKVLDMAYFIKKCCEKTLWSQPQILTNNQINTSNKYTGLFEYNMDKIKNTGFCNNTNYQNEIEQLIHYCKVNFKNLSFDTN